MNQGPSEHCYVTTDVPLADVRDVFDLFDFWDGRDGLVDGFKVGDFLRCCGLNPTQAVVYSNGGMKKLGTSLHTYRINSAVALTAALPVVMC